MSVVTLCALRGGYLFSVIILGDRIIFFFLFKGRMKIPFLSERWMGLMCFLFYMLLCNGIPVKIYFQTDFAMDKLNKYVF